MKNYTVNYQGTPVLSKKRAPEKANIPPFNFDGQLFQITKSDRWFPSQVISVREAYVSTVTTGVEILGIAVIKGYINPFDPLGETEEIVASGYLAADSRKVLLTIPDGAAGVASIHPSEWLRVYYLNGSGHSGVTTGLIGTIVT